MANPSLYCLNDFTGLADDVSKGEIDGIGDPYTIFLGDSDPISLQTLKIEVLTGSAVAVSVRLQALLNES